jgi:hypothetical protein
MGFGFETFAWEPTAVVDSHWHRDPAFVGSDGKSLIAAASLAAWEADMRGEHLKPFAAAGIDPEPIKVRPLTMDEAAYCDGIRAQTPGGPGFIRACLVAFRLCVSFPEAPPELVAPGGAAKCPIVSAVGPFRGLSDGFTNAVLRKFSGIAFFYGSRILDAASETDDEKKASSQPSTPSASSGPSGPPASDTTAQRGA